MLYYPTGRIELRENYKDGVLDGLVETYRQNGELTISANYKDGNRTFEEAVDFSDLEEREDGYYEVGSDTPYTGTWVFHHENGVLAETGFFIEGKENGLIESYFEDGQLAQATNYKDGVEDGIAEYYFEDGTLLYRLNHEDGEVLGRCYEPDCTPLSFEEDIPQLPN